MKSITFFIKNNSKSSKYRYNPSTNTSCALFFALEKSFKDPLSISINYDDEKEMVPLERNGFLLLKIVLQQITNNREGALPLWANIVAHVS